MYDVAGCNWGTRAQGLWVSASLTRALKCVGRSCSDVPPCTCIGQSLPDAHGVQVWGLKNFGSLGSTRPSPYSNLPPLHTWWSLIQTPI